MRRLRRTGGQDPQRTTGGAHGFRQLRGGHGYRGIRHGTVQPRTTESGLAGCGLRPVGGRRPQTVGRPGGTGARREVPTLAATHRLGHHPRPARSRHRHVFHAHAIRRPHLMGIVHPHRPLVGTGFPPQRLAATAARHGQHGHLGVEQYAHCLRLQPFQHALSGILDGTGRRTSRLFRSGERHHRLYPVGAALGRKGQGQHLDGHPQAHGAATPYGHHRERPWGNT